MQPLPYLRDPSWCHPPPHVCVCCGATPVSMTPSGQTPGASSQNRKLLNKPTSKCYKKHRLRSARPNSLLENNSSSTDSETDSLQIDPWALIKIEATKAGNWQMAEKTNTFPVEYRQGRNGGESANKTWRPNSNKELVQLRNIAKEHGRGSHIFRNFLEAMFSAHVLLPHDIKNISHCLLSPAEYMLWERHWKKQLKTLLDSYSADADKTNFTVEQLAEEGELKKPADQLETLNKDALQDVGLAAKTSLLFINDESMPSSRFSTIKQGADESFIKFVDRIKDALEKQIESPEARKELLCKLAMSNSNAKCKTILRSLPIDTDPTIEQMLECCTRHLSTDNTVAQAVAKGIAEGVSGAYAVIASKEQARCHHCSNIGHYIKDCPERTPPRYPRYTYQRLQYQHRYQQRPGNTSRSPVEPRAMTTNQRPPRPNHALSQEIQHHRRRFQQSTRSRWEPIANWEQVPLNPTAMWAQVVGPSKPTIECGLNYKGERIHLPGMLDTGC
ncbi:uncharacterized protein LOC127060969 [Serinus canaria]|uniref:uncharacterized protein LOC127060969 n=1 Tax=Serinus canaria TaxID=9135 RepID=UPI0021CCC30C|nr:uncharacterized protein LOC127060969 [Serinus canaria]